jgi:uncharacterized paraquat-inducible protein A
MRQFDADAQKQIDLIMEDFSARLNESGFHTLLQRLFIAEAKAQTYEAMLACSCCKKIIKPKAKRFCSTRCKDTFWNEIKRQKRLRKTGKQKNKTESSAK